ncbi:HAD-IB family hydrolase [Marinobacter daepoensis]|uniref:HAD family hydrolase n=1 Tax=Marinobacter daepoensis TaxID=262077 RepID=A0ABS3BDV9_9GAMM|nr:HAD family hydrolase [Marinobacter daepoensis]MBN7770011.1 HAD family hydrolase [Marinobacter daepoensis]MBY6032567.1 HAD-IB family hydrolase [Marinobacter daepoensis]MBY6080399.1 HAD-IB family hydrolase [Marinobacter daepoensis]
MLAIFDLDDTLIRGDSANLFTAFLRCQSLQPDPMASARDIAFLQDYQNGTLNLEDYMRVSLAPLRGWNRLKVEDLVTSFIRRVIRPRVCAKMQKRLDWHRQNGHQLLVISATGEHLVRPIAAALGVPEALGVELIWDKSGLTGEIGTRRPYREGKIEALQQWLAAQENHPEATWFYSDSHNDLPLLEWVDYPVAVNPDPTLLARAKAEGWPVMGSARA